MYGWQHLPQFAIYWTKCLLHQMCTFGQSKGSCFLEFCACNSCDKKNPETESKFCFSKYSWLLDSQFKIKAMVAFECFNSDAANFFMIYEFGVTKLSLMPQISALWHDKCLMWQMLNCGWNRLECTKSAAATQLVERLHNATKDVDLYVRWGFTWQKLPLLS